MDELHPADIAEMMDDLIDGAGKIYLFFYLMGKKLLMFLLKFLKTTEEGF